MQARMKQGLETAVIIGGNVGNLFAVTAYVITNKIRDEFCAEYVTDIMAIQLTIENISAVTAESYNERFSTALMSLCLSKYSPLHYVPAGYIIGAALGFGASMAYNLAYADDDVVPDPVTVATAEQPLPEVPMLETSEKPFVIDPEKDKPTSNIEGKSSATFFNARKRSLLELRDRFKKSCALPQSPELRVSDNDISVPNSTGIRL